MCGAGSGGTTASVYTSVGNWDAYYALCDGVVGSSGFTYNNGAAFGNGVGQCIIKTGSPQSFASTTTFISTRIAALVRAYLPTNSATSPFSSASSPVSIAASATSSLSATSTSVTATSPKAADPTVASNPCPSYNFTTYTDTNNVRYQILCGFDTSPASFGATLASNMSSCLAACDTRSGCAAVSYVGQTCYFKSSYASESVSSNFNSAFLYNVPNYPIPSSGSGNASSGCGSALPAGIQAGGTTNTFYIQSAEQNRSYDIHVPSTYNITTPSPLIVAYHGNTETPATIEGYSGFSSEAWNPFGIVVYPAGVSVSSSDIPSYLNLSNAIARRKTNIHKNRWQNDPATVSASPFIDDQQFTHDLLASLTSTYCIDTSRILGTGMSNGGGFLGVLACNSTLSTQFSAFPPVPNTRTPPTSHARAIHPTLSSTTT